jgi:hypothetical protein
MMLLVLVSCTNSESVIEEQQLTKESEAIITSLTQLRQNFNDDGNLNNDENHSGNIVFDFCFDFVYPLTLSYNNGTTVIVDNLDSLIDIMLGSNNELYINGIAFPFDVELYSDDTNAIEVITINNEEEFIDLLEICDFDDFETCICPEDYNPVCVEISDPNGENFTITYPNACYAECDGFTEDDFVDNCEDDYNCPGGNECFNFNFPISIVTDDEETLTINSQEELDSALYNAYYFDFVYPFEVTTEEGDIEVIEDVEDFEDLLEDCFYDGNDDDCECEDEEFDPVCIEVENPNGVIEIFTFPNECIAECEGFDSEDFIDCGNTGPIECSIEDITNTLADYCWSIDFVDFNEFIYNLNSDGTYEMQDVGGNSGGSLLTSGTWSVVAANDTFYITLNAEVAVYNDEWVVIQCNESNESLEMQSLVYPQADIYSINCNGGDGGDYDCSSEDGISNILTECPWIIDFIDFNEFIYTFNIDGTYEVQSDDNLLTTGTWDLIAANNAYIINLNAELSEYNDVWLIGDCDEEMGLTIGSIDYPQAEIYSVNCD